MSWWNKKRIVEELKRMHKYLGLEGEPLQRTVDYIMLHPSVVSREVYKELSTKDFPEIRKGIL